MIVDPRPMTVKQWTDQMTLQLSAFGSVGRLDDENDWQRWAENVILLVNLPSLNINPFLFSDWKEWAIRFLQVAEPQLS